MSETTTHGTDAHELAELFMFEDWGLDEIEPILNALPELLREDSPAGAALRHRLGLTVTRHQVYETGSLAWFASARWQTPKPPPAVPAHRRTR